MNVQGLWLVIALTLAHAIFPSLSVRGPLLRISNGPIRGVYKTSRNGRPFEAYMGIPFAKPPERFQPPEPAENWSIVRNATEYGSRCAQSIRKGNQAPVVMGTELQCLNINVFTPSTTGRFPVIVVLESGGFIYGYADNSGPKYFLDFDIVLVSFNYRVGAFGFLSTGDHVVPGNNGLKDQTLALYWVQNNIRFFGGNPRQVTILGESSGGASVMFHTLSPLSQGLFRSAICQSGSALNARYFTPDLSSDTKTFAEKLGCPTSNSTEMVACLRERPMADIRDNIFQDGNVLNTERAIFTPTIEKGLTPHQLTSAFLTASPESLLRQGQFHKVPMLMTLTKDEGLLFYSALVLKTPALLQELNEKWFNVAPIAFHYSRHNLSNFTKNRISNAIHNFYFGPRNSITKDNAQNLTDLYSDSFIMSSLKRHALYHARAAPVYTAVLAYPGEWSRIFSYGYTSPIGVAHSDDLQYLFENPTVYPEFVKGSLPELVSQYFVRLWSNFATNGNPGFVWGNVTWTPISRQEIRTGDIRWLYMKENPEYLLEPLRSRLRFWDWVHALIQNEVNLG